MYFFMNHGLIPLNTAPTPQNIFLMNCYLLPEESILDETTSSIKINMTTPKFMVTLHAIENPELNIFEFLLFSLLVRLLKTDNILAFPKPNIINFYVMVYES